MEESKVKEPTIVYFQTSYSENLEVVCTGLEYALSAFDAENKPATNIENKITVILGDKIKNNIENINSEINKWGTLLSEKKTETSEIREVLLSQGNSSDDTEKLLYLISKAAAGETIVVETIDHHFMKRGLSRINARYDLDLDYTTYIDINSIELLKIIDKADDTIAENSADPEKLATAYLKKAQCMQKDDELSKHIGTKKLKFKDTVDDTQEQIKNLIEKALELHPNMPEALMQMGKVYFNMSAAEEGNIDKAIDMYTKAIQLKSDYAAAHNNLGVIYASESYSHYKNDSLHLNKAIHEYTETIRIRPFDAVYYYNRGQNYSILENHEKAIDDFSNAIKYGSDKFKEKSLIFYMRGDQYLCLRNYGKAIADFSEAIRFMPNYYKSLRMRGSAYLGAGEKDKADADFYEYYRKKRELKNFKKIIPQLKKALSEKHFFDSTNK
jgi:tetratricopeptide (TPR) repeat protein